ncbi:MAG: hypothetical protein WAN65_18195, partial [Candidatus Sulfotelmatobacter sp.]
FPKSSGSMLLRAPQPGGAVEHAVDELVSIGGAEAARRAGQVGDPFDFAQGRLFAPPEKRLRSG